MGNINFSSIDGYSVKKAKKLNTKSTILVGAYLLLLIPIFIFIVLIFFMSPLFFIGVLALLAIFSKLRNKNTSKRNKFGDNYEQLAIDNNWEFNHHISEEFSSLIPVLGDNYKQKKGIKGELGGKKFMFLYDDNGAITIIKTQKLLPEAFFINSMINSPLLKDGFDKLMQQEGLEHFSLEGDFDRSLVLYAKPEKRIEVLSVVAPDFMIGLIEHGTIGMVAMKEFNILMSSYSTSREHIRDLLETTESLAKELK